MFKRELDGLEADFFESASEFLEASQNTRKEGGDNWNGSWDRHWMESSREECIRKFNSGAPELVAKSDAILERVESKFEFQTNGRRTVDAVAGGVPNVAAVIAGNPMNMRRRQRVETAMAPLTVVVDLTSSASLDSKKLVPRGIAVLALTRLLTGRRPVTLWVGVGLNKGSDAVATFFRVDTTPIDLGRAAWWFTNPGVARGFGYGYLNKKLKAGPSWPFGSVDKWRTKGQKIISTMLGEDVLFVPPVFADDDITISNSDKWLEDMLKQYGGKEGE
jgi:hypothetical protein